MRHLLLLLFIITNCVVNGQNVTGSVHDKGGSPLPYSSILIKGTSSGVTANQQGEFSLTLQPGTYTLICQHVGYEKHEEAITVQDKPIHVSFVLELQKLLLKEVIVRSGAEDPAYGIIRQAIKKRDYYRNQVNAFECEAYIKGLVKLRKLPERIFGRKVPADDKKQMRLDSSGKGIIYLSESISKVAVQRPHDIKIEVVSSRQSGSEGFGFGFPTFITLYQNNVNFAQQLNPRGFISPLADGALNFYKYKYMGSFYEDGKEINTIKVMPKRSYEPLFSGTINITEGDWRIHSCDLLVTKTSQLEILDTLELTQIHGAAAEDVWRVKNQVLHFSFKQLGIDAVGNFVNVYSKYNVHPQFRPHYFDRVIMSYDTAVSKKTRAYWDSIRPVPLEPEEAKDYKVKDSLYQIEKDSSLSDSNIDSLKKRQGHVTIKQVVIKGIDRTHYSKTNEFKWTVDPIISSLQFNPQEGVVADIGGTYEKKLKGWKSNLVISPTIRYGFGNTHLNPSVEVRFASRNVDTDRKLRRHSWTFAGGKKISQFNEESDIGYFGNTYSALVNGKNPLKIYEQYFASIRYNKRWENGVRITLSGGYEDRLPLDNITDYTFFKNNVGKYTPNYPYLLIPHQFSRHQATLVRGEISVKPGQRYIQFPNNKISIGSKYPTFTLGYTQGVKDLLGSDVDFGKWSFSVHDDVNLKLAGVIKYKVVAAGFLNNSIVPIQDVQYFNGNESMLAKDYLNTFQLLPYYSAMTTAPLYGMVFVEHHLNGLLSNKIPLLKQLNWHIEYGANAYYVNSRENYSEVFAGLENIFKVMRGDLVLANYGNTTHLGIRLGFGGLLGAGMRATNNIGERKRR